VRRLVSFVEPCKTLGATERNLHHVDIANPQGVTLSGSTAIHGLLRLVGGGRVIVPNYGPLKFVNQLPEVSDGVYDVDYTSIVGNVTATRNVTFPSGVFVDGGALALGGHKIDTRYFTVRGGSLTMNNPMDTLVVRTIAGRHGSSYASALDRHRESPGERRSGQHGNIEWRRRVVAPPTGIRSATSLVSGDDYSTTAGKRVHHDHRFPALLGALRNRGWYTGARPARRARRRA
jgi:hypothetical protein